MSPKDEYGRWETTPTPPAAHMTQASVAGLVRAPVQEKPIKPTMAPLDYDTPRELTVRERIFLAMVATIPYMEQLGPRKHSSCAMAATDRAIELLKERQS